MILASILLLADGQSTDALPDRVRENIDSFRQMHPGIDHRLFTDVEVRQLINDNFGREVLAAYEALKPFAYRSDLARYCILHSFGGAYADLSLRFVAPLRMDGEPQLFRDFLGAAPWDTVSGVFTAPPRHKALTRAIELVCENVANRYYGRNSRCPTGPTLFGRAIATSCRDDEIVTGDSLWLDLARAGLGSYGEGRRHCMTFAGKVICFKNRLPRDDFPKMGIAGGNSYDAMWKARDIYRG